MLSVLTVLAVLCVGSAFAQVPDFHLVDINSSSPRRDQAVSPRDYIMQVSAYYLGAAT